jgi:hypothetical protein
MRSSTSTKPKRKPDGRLSVRALNRAFLARQLLLAPSSLAPLEAIEHLGGLQAQVPRPPYIGLHTRLATFTRDELHALITAKTVVRATMMRATIHLVSARDFLALRPALSPLLSAMLIRTKRIDPAKLDALARSHFPSAIATFSAAVARAFAIKHDASVGWAVRSHLPLVRVPTETRWSFSGNAYFDHACTYLSTTISATADPDDLIVRYLRAFGPASIKDAQAWSGLRNLAPAFERLRPLLVSFRDEKDRELFDLPDAPRPDEHTPAPIRFLPDYDNAMLGHDDRSRIIDDAYRPSLTSANGIVYATYLVDGRIAGKWTITRDKKRATITLAPYTKLAKPTRTALDEEAERIARFIEPDATSISISVSK